MRRSRSSCASSSTGTPTAAARTVTTAFPSRDERTTRPPSKSEISSRSASTAVSTSCVSGTWTWISATVSALRMVEFRMVSEASLSFGITSRAPSSRRMNVYVSPISSTWPVSLSTRTRSPSRSGWAIAIRMPATKFESVRCAAKPSTSPSTAVDASTPPATVRTGSSVSSAERTPTVTITEVIVRRSTR